MELDNATTAAKINKKKEIKCFISIIPQTTNMNNKAYTTPVYFPIENINLEKLTIKKENEELFLKQYINNKSRYDKAIKLNYIAIAFNEDYTEYKKSMMNLVQLKYEEISKKVYLTNYKLIKNLINENSNNVSVYLLQHSQKIEEILKKINYLIKIISKEERIQSFVKLIHLYKLEKLSLNESYLNTRNDFLQFINYNKDLQIFRDPCSRKNVYPALDMLIFDYDKEDQDDDEELTINIIDLKTYEDPNLKFNFKNSYITYLSYLESNELYSRIKVEYGLDVEINLSRYTNNLFVEKELSINFGKIEKIDELAVGKYGFFDECPGQMLYDLNFLPLGISVTKQNNHSVNSLFITNKSDKNISYNIFLPFSNQGVLYLFKQYLNVDVNIDKYFKFNMFLIRKVPKDKSELIEDERLFFNYDDNLDSLLDNKPAKKYIDYMKLKPVSGYIVNERIIDDFDNKSKKRFREVSFCMDEEEIDKEKYKEMIDSLKLKAKNKRFSYMPFNDRIHKKQHEKKQLATYIDMEIDKLFSDQ